MKVLQYLLNQRLIHSFSKIIEFGKTSQLREDEVHISQLRQQLEYQVDLINERDNKIKSKENYIQMKEKGIIELEKGLTEKSKRLLELSKSMRQVKRLSPKKYRQPSKTSKGIVATQNIHQQSNINIYKTFNHSKTRNSQITGHNSQNISQLHPATSIYISLDDSSQVNTFQQGSLTNRTKSKKVKIDETPFQNKRSSLGQNKNNTGSMQVPAVNFSIISNLNTSSIIGKENSKKDTDKTQYQHYQQQQNSNINVTKKQSNNLPLQVTSTSNINLTQISGKSPRYLQSQKNITKSIVFKQISLNLQESDCSPQSAKVVSKQAVIKLQKHILNLTKRKYFNQFKQYNFIHRRQDAALYLMTWTDRKLLSMCMIKWLRFIYSDELQSHETFEAVREKVQIFSSKCLQKLLRAIILGQKASTNKEHLLHNAFKQWKSHEYQMLLEGLKKYSALLDKNLINDTLSHNKSNTSIKTVFTTTFGNQF
ncbi:UNKNOWN [Stylonychia lemnae]|uniref:Uncharacterized protein n=1 Tax=Stylonychia lemnae TaxID=5949 RepID=A0A077ZQ19_STYLE|nr:UNKNOWN [Stylonychia lemnae]|eukprot:CDW71475.1 UNKNOWN [Stylonychia lemnae]